MAWNTRSTARTLAIVNQILEIDPDNTEALIMKADNTEAPEARAQLLFKALNSLNSPESFNPDDKDLLFTVINQRLAYTFFAMSKLDEAFEFCEKALASDEDTEDEGAMKSLYYRILLERREWQKILAETLRDDERSLAWAYARLIAAYMIAPENGRRVCAGMFWDALMLAPDVPFYMLGYFEEPDDDAEPEAHNDFDFALMYYDTVSVSDDFYNWFSRGVILFGLLSGRFDEKEREYMVDALDSLGGYEEYEKMSRILIEGDDEAVIEALAANKCLSE